MVRCGEAGGTRSGALHRSYISSVPGRHAPLSLGEQGDTCDLGTEVPQSSRPSPPPLWGACTMLTLQFGLGIHRSAWHFTVCKGFLPVPDQTSHALSGQG